MLIWGLPPPVTETDNALLHPDHVIVAELLV
jgi:hypothetical protein